MMRLILTVLTWALMIGIAAGACIVMLPVALVTWPFDRQRFVSGIIFRRAGRLVAQLSPMWQFKALTPYPKRLNEAHVVVSNHASHLDCFCISFLPYEMKWLAKRSLFFIPIIGWAMFLAGDVSVVRTKGKSIGFALRRCRKILDNGMHVFIFPEGTRATQTDLLPFKSGAFRLALESGAPILPLGVWGTKQGLPRGAFLFNQTKARVAVGPSIPTAPILSQYTTDSTVDWPSAIACLKEKTEREVRAQMKRAAEGIGQTIS